MGRRRRATTAAVAAGAVGGLAAAVRAARTAGADADEVARVLPGDDLVIDARVRPLLPALDVGHAVMEQVQLRRLRRRAERTAGHEVVDDRRDQTR